MLRQWNQSVSDRRLNRKTDKQQTDPYVVLFFAGTTKTAKYGTFMAGLQCQVQNHSILESKAELQIRRVKA